ncbi:hypothetical protein E4U42_005607 [Claviceps africana]|uniref:Kinesin-like protein n=1 Tax=Claviceps africana TaxID=83212 RepID=A0A8K0NFG0_9HYPO|nr:hypothetical protein E4U42_005607 [Claviceps africana]
MESPLAKPSSHSLFEVYLRLRPPPANANQTDRILNVEAPLAHEKPHPSCITLNPPADRRRAIEKFSFTRVFEDTASQLDVFKCTEIPSLAEGVLAPQGGEGTDAVVATLGVTGSGKTHTILGSKSERGLTQLALDVVFRSIGSNTFEPTTMPSIMDSLQACDSSEATLSTATHFLETTFADSLGHSRAPSRATTPMNGEQSVTSPTSRRNLARPSASALPQLPDTSSINVSCDQSAEYAVVISMYEVHNDRIYDLLTPAAKSAATKEYRRRPLLFKSTELSPDRKVVAGLRKVVCTTLKEALMVLEAGLLERRVTGTGSNSVSSRSHGFFCFEVKKRTRGRPSGAWSGSKLTIVDLAGSERARDAKTQGATLVEAGKINESLMYLGQCLQSQSEVSNSSKPNVVPYRQCKLTELLFSNSFPSLSSSVHAHAPRRNPQRGVMIVTADPRGDFNATSQILRYSALAREVTVPRVRSFTTGAILAQPQPAGNARPVSPVQQQQQQQHQRSFVPSGASTSHRNHNHSPPMNADERTTMEIAALEIARMSDEIDQLRLEVDEHLGARMAAEAHLSSVEDQMLDLEAIIRDECATEFEQRLMVEIARFKASLALEQERNEEHWDRKVDILERGLGAGGSFNADDSEADKENVLVEDLTQQVERLRRENAILKRELAGRSPSKRKPLEERDDFPARAAGGGGRGGMPPSSSRSEAGVANLGRKLQRLRVSSTDGAHAGSRTALVGGGSPKKMRKLGASKRWVEESDELMGM